MGPSRRLTRSSMTSTTSTSSCVRVRLGCRAWCCQCVDSKRRAGRVLIVMDADFQEHPSICLCACKSVFLTAHPQHLPETILYMIYLTRWRTPSDRLRLAYATAPVSPWSQVGPYIGTSIPSMRACSHSRLQRRIKHTHLRVLPRLRDAEMGVSPVRHPLSSQRATLQKAA